LEIEVDSFTFPKVQQSRSFVYSLVCCLFSQSSLNSGSTPNPRFEELAAANKSRQKKGGGGAHSSDESLSDDVELAELDDEPVSIWIRIRTDPVSWVRIWIHIGNKDPDPGGSNELQK
jgi:hypothetical protein